MNTNFSKTALDHPTFWVDFLYQLCGCPGPTLHNWQGGSLTHTIVITLQFLFLSEGHREPCNLVASSLALEARQNILWDSSRKPSDSENDTPSHCAMLPPKLNSVNKQCDISEVLTISTVHINRNEFWW